VKADVAILEWRDGDFEFCDNDGITVNGKRRPVTHLTLNVAASAMKGRRNSH
jgi:hypothetical protein